LQIVPEIDFTRDEKTRKTLMLENYIAVTDFKDTLMSYTSDYRKWLDSYVNLHFERGYSAPQVDSALTSAGKKLIERAKLGHPAMYGKMVDYFFEGYESMGLQGGIKMLAPYVADPKCPASKKKMLQRRLDGLGTLFVGAKAPDFTINDAKGNPVQFHKFGTNKPYKLLMIWSADCEHCQEVTKQLYPYYINSPVKEQFDVLAVSLDDTETEIPMWEKVIVSLPAWKHARAKGGLLSPEAKAYFVVATPVMVLVDSKTNTIVAMPETARDVAGFFRE
jgi:thioredoxin-related protein